MTLGALGVGIEMTIHNAMHMRWATFSGSFRPDPLQDSGEIDPTGGETIGAEWDDPRYDFLGDTYSSHVNPIFWKLHGWIDDRIEDWKIANGVFGNDFWKGTWVGKMAGHEEAHEMGHEGVHGAGTSIHALLADPQRAAQHVSEAQQVAKLIARAGVFHTFMPSASIEAW